jgi:hypothetical protein
MDENAFVHWTLHQKPWQRENEILTSGVPLPLNGDDNPNAAHRALLKEVRNHARNVARVMEIVTDGGGSRREP